jgi:hypothetical protein
MRSLRDLAPNALTLLFRHGAMSQAKLEAAWDIAVGHALSKATTVRLADGGTVEASAADHRWWRELERSSAVIQGRLNGLLGVGTVTRLVLIGGPEPARRRRRTRREDKTTP